MPPSALGDFLLSPKPVKPGDSKTGEGRAFVVEHSRNACSNDTVE